MVTAAPAILSAENVSPSVNQATTPAIGGIRYCSGALRATPRTALTQVQTIHPRNEEMTAAQNMPSQTFQDRPASGAATKEGSVISSNAGAPKSSVYASSGNAP